MTAQNNDKEQGAVLSGADLVAEIFRKMQGVSSKDALDLTVLTLQYFNAISASEDNEEVPFQAKTKAGGKQVRTVEPIKGGGG